MAAKVIVYTGTAAPDDVDASGWAALLTCGSHTKEVHGFTAKENARRMELRAMIGAVNAMKTPAEVVIKTTSAHIAKSYPNLKNWKANNWRSLNGVEIKDADLWKQLCSAAVEHQTTLTVEQAAEENNRSRCIAKAAAYSTAFND